MENSSIKDNDIKRFLFYLLRHPGEFYRAVQSRKASMLNKTAPYELNEKAIQKIQKESVVIKNYFLLSQAEKKAEKGYALTLDLAGELLNINVDQEIPWRTVFPDGEAVAALHRFIWLQQLMTEELEDKGNTKLLTQYAVQMILSWIQEFMPSGKIENVEGCHSEVWQTYSVAERVISWIYCLLLSTEKDIENEKIVSAIREQLLFIASHLEYYGEIFTGNHLSNDGRALFIGGCVLQSNELMNFGLKIMLGEAERIFSDDLFLREGSAHYQFLITRNYTEAMLFAQKCGNIEAENRLKDLVRRLTEGCKFFLYENELKEWDIPRIGDISPDCTPEWLLGVPYVATYFLENKKTELTFPKTVGWHTLIWELFNFEKKKKEEPTNSFSAQGVYCFQDWLRINRGNWIIFAHINHICHPYALGHVHQDSGGILIFHKGRKIIMDTGRKKYLDTMHGGKGKEWFGHSILSVDEMSPLITSRAFYTSKYLQKISKEAPAFCLENDLATIKNHGYERIKGVGCHQRSICLQEKNVKISDSVAGKGKHKLILLFHLPYHVEKCVTGYEFEIEGEKYSIQMPQNITSSNVVYGSDSVLSTASDIYGSEYDISTIICKAFVDLPWKCETVIRYEG